MPMPLNSIDLPLRYSGRLSLPIVGALTTCGALLRLYQLGTESLWADEALTRMWITAPRLSGTFASITEGVHPPAYFLCLRAWAALTGSSLFSMRVFSALFSIATIPLFYIFARRLMARAASLISTALLALSPFHVYYAQEARGYAFIVFLEVAFALSLCRGMRSIDEGREPRGSDWCVLVSSSFLLIYSSYLSALVVAGGIAVALIYYLTNRGRAVPVRAGLIWIAFSFLSVLPCVYFALVRARTGQGIDWLPPLSADTFRGIVLGFTYGVFLPPRPAWIYLIPLAGCAALGLASTASILRRGHRRSPRHQDRPETGVSLSVWITLLFAFLLAAPLLISIWRPVVFYGQRYLIPATVPWYLLLGAGLGRLWSGRARWLAPVILLAILTGPAFYFVDYFNSRQKRTYDKMSEFLDENFGEGDTIVVIPEYNDSVLQYYLRRPFRFLPHEWKAIALELTRDENEPNGAVWFVSIDERPDPLENRVHGVAVRGRTAIFDITDLPGVLLRATPYRADESPSR